MTLVILEDNAERVEAMRAQLQKEAINLAVEVFPDAPSCISWLGSHLHEATIISLDHDLEPVSGALADPGTGRDVADWLAGQLPKRPVIVHSSNNVSAFGMQMALEEGGIVVDRVSPYEDLKWIRQVWIGAVREILER